MLRSLRATMAGHAKWKPPAWLDHWNKHDLKILFRCWVAIWCATLMIWIQPALENIGQSAFFAALVLFIAPPASIVFVYLLAALSLLLGMCLAWAWGLLVMRCALSARPSAWTARKLQELGMEAAANARSTGRPVAVVQRILVVEGFLLHTGTTVVYYVMSLVFIYVLARLRTSNPKLLLTQIFGTIATDLFLLFGPSLPAYNASLASLLVKPAAIGVAIGVVCTILLFPGSASSMALRNMVGLVATLDTGIDSMRRRLRGETVSRGVLDGARAKMLGIYKATAPAIGFLPIDVSRGLWGPADIRTLQRPIREAMMASFSLLQMHVGWLDTSEKESKLREHREMHSSGHASESGAASSSATQVAEKHDDDHKHCPGHRETMAYAHVMDALSDPEETSMHDEALAALRDASDELLTTCSASIRLAAKSISTVNSCRWIGKPSPETLADLTSQLRETLSRLQKAKDSSIVSTTEGVLDAYADIFDEKGDLIHELGTKPPIPRGIVLAMVIEERILVAADRIEKLLEALLALMETRTTSRLWFPERLRFAASWLLDSRRSVPSPNAFPGSESDPDDDEGKGGGGKGNNDNEMAKGPPPTALTEESKEEYRRLHVSHAHPGRRAPRGRVSRGLVWLYKWLFNPAGMFALRMVFVTLITALPSAFKHSAGFFYREKGIWAVISAQTCMMVYMADFTVSLVSRFVSTILGGVLGLVAWYMGSGHGKGNPYGMAASAGVMLPIALWLRLFLPPLYARGTILLGATFLLIIGFSYDEGHIPQYGLPGVGWRAFYKRVASVLIGFFAAAIVQMFPRPPSATKHVSRSLARGIRSLADHYALLISHWGREDRYTHLSAVAEDISIALAERLTALTENISVLQFEMTTGPFDKETLQKTQYLVQTQNQVLRRLLDVSATLPRHLQQRLARNFGLLDERMIGDVFATLSIAEQSLITGMPLPERMPTPLLSRFYERWDAQHQTAMLSKSLVRDDDYRRYCVAMSSYLKFLSTLDSLVLMLKQRLGENHVVHFVNSSA
jgi:hypothetical protein